MGGKASNFPLPGKNTYYADDVSSEPNVRTEPARPTEIESGNGPVDLGEVAAGASLPEVGFADTEDDWLTHWWDEGT